MGRLAHSGAGGHHVIDDGDAAPAQLGPAARLDRERGRDPGLYYLRVFGEPGATRAWGWRFGGHHVSLNNFISDGALVATTPCFLGADPAVSPLLGGAVNRPLARVEDLARDLIRSMSPDLRDRAVLLPRAPSDLVTANRTAVSAGDRAIPLAGIWRDEGFPDPVEQAKLQALSDAIDDAAAYEDADHAAVEYTVTPKGVAAAELDAEQGDDDRGHRGQGDQHPHLNRLAATADGYHWRQ